ncbi:unnamed protein product [Moneuplotes crassus]|uniref:Uncharacterized protein n=1 Tax=Euplotes crassus TaxID=5936 RepID=A0AAD1UN12_EUPCR|nr:unnamed protein product [Moneuplotes crassus]
MESQNRLGEKDNSEYLKEEKITLEEENRVNKRVGSSYSFNNLAAKLEHRVVGDANPEDILLNYKIVDFRRQQTLAFAKKPNFLGSFGFQKFCFHSMNTKKTIVNCINSSFPKKMKALQIYSHRTLTSNISPVFNAMMRISHRVSEELWILYSRISAHQFKRVMASYKHVNRIRFHDCKISIPAVFDLSQSLRDTKINELEFLRCEDPESSDSTSDSQSIINLIQGLATSPDFKHSIKRIVALDCGIEDTKYTEILDENGFNHVESH